MSKNVWVNYGDENWKHDYKNKGNANKCPEGTG